MQSIDEFGPIEYLLVKFPDGKVTTQGFKRLLQLVDSHVIRILDLEFVVSDATGHAAIVPIESVSVTDETRKVLDQFVGASSGLVDDEDTALVAASLDAGDIAAILIYEEIAVLSMIDAWQSEGASLIGMDAIKPAELEAALDATDAAA